MSESAGTPPIDDVVMKLEVTYTRGMKRLASLRRVRTVLGLSLVLVIAAWLYTLIRQGATMCRPENFEPHLKVEMQALSPKIGESMLAVVKEVGPHYRTAGEERLREILPTVQQSISTEVDALKVNLEAIGRDELDAALRRVEERHMGRVKSQFPVLADEQARERLKKRWFDAIDHDNREAWKPATPSSAPSCRWRPT